MFDLSGIGRTLLVIGLVIAGIGLALVFAGKIPWFGRLPGDFFWGGKNVSFSFPFTTATLVGLFLPLTLWFIPRR